MEKTANPDVMLAGVYSADVRCDLAADCPEIALHEHEGGHYCGRHIAIARALMALSRMVG